MEGGPAHFSLRRSFRGGLGEKRRQEDIPSLVTLPGGGGPIYLVCTYPTGEHLMPVGVYLFSKYLFSLYDAPGAF